MSVGHPLPEKLRAAIVRAFHEQGFTYDQTAEVLGVGRASVSRILRKERETGSLKPKPKGGGNFSPINGAIAEELRRIVTERPDATVAEFRAALAEITGITSSDSSVKRALKRLGFSRKKRSSSRQSGTPRRTSGGGASSRRF